ncbi:PfkB family carbohydrate kinase [Microbacterium sp. KSW4-11]|uniref:PfkB family carbohydrate kinase n=1 Tax=Microbacterium gawkjiense TaxID=3067309 RepID=A0ABU3GE65_9MICO|nr:PfkB family carbohydrate kinase [Microbacterium sp. KSW4-11]MDT3318101.1 PfkB family carbohydrate kinase [Microbacterium sp. KSW4-11]
MTAQTTTATFLVIGESLIDVVKHAGERTEMVGGSPANVALGLARLGHTVRFHTALAHDRHGNHIAAHLQDAGVQTDEQSWCLSTTSTAAATIQPDGAADYLFEIEATMRAPQLQGERYVHVGSISAFMPPSAGLIQGFTAQLPDDVVLSFDPNIRSALIGAHHDALTRFEGIARKATIVKLSDSDAQWLYPDWDLGQVVDHLLFLDIPLVAVTSGAGGSIVASPRAIVRMDTPVVTVRDTIGAGDTFMAALIHTAQQSTDLVRGADEAGLTRAAAYCNTAAALTVQRPGADLPTRDEVDRALATRFANATDGTQHASAQR